MPSFWHAPDRRPIPLRANVRRSVACHSGLRTWYSVASVSPQYSIRLQMLPSCSCTHISGGQISVQYRLDTLPFSGNMTPLLYWLTLGLLVLLIFFYSFGPPLLKLYCMLLRSPTQASRQEHMPCNTCALNSSGLASLRTDEKNDRRCHLAFTLPSRVPPTNTSLVALRQQFLPPYLLAMAAEWLSIPYLYHVLQEDLGLPSHSISTLYVVSYAAAAVSSPISGWAADQFGRRSACLICCVTHAIATMTTVLSVLWTRIQGRRGLPTAEGVGMGGGLWWSLVAGRILAGLAMSLLWTVFESWLVTEWNRRAAERDPDDRLSDADDTLNSGLCCSRVDGLSSTRDSDTLASMFGAMTSANCLTAVLFALIGHCLVSMAGSRLPPFILGAVSGGNSILAAHLVETHSDLSTRFVTPSLWV